MILITGATGHLGHAIVEQLLELIPAEQVAVSARDSSKAQDLERRGVQVRRGDFDDPNSLETAFEGAAQVLIVSSNARSSGGDPLAQHRNAIEAAKAAGARRIVYTSHMAASERSAFPPMRDHAATESMLAGSGVPWTSLRNGFYASTVPMLIGDAATSGVLAAAADGKVAWTTHVDLAAAAARILVDPNSFEGPTPVLTAGHALDLQDIAAIVSRLTGRAVERKVLTDTEQETVLLDRNLPRTVVDISLGMYRASRAGEFALVGPLLEQLLGRKPTTLDSVLAESIGR